MRGSRALENKDGSSGLDHSSTIDRAMLAFFSLSLSTSSAPLVSPQPQPTSPWSSVQPPWLCHDP
jgi:hypothetical protein